MPDGLRIPMREMYRNVGESIRKHRKKAKISQEALADLVGHTRTSITNIEAGRQRIPLDLVFRLASALKIDARDLLPASTSSLPPEIAKKLPKDYDEAKLRALKRIVAG
jgi:transcriptional regulator with XRE-family HTH domain